MMDNTKKPGSVQLNDATENNILLKNETNCQGADDFLEPFVKRDESWIFISENKFISSSDVLQSSIAVNLDDKPVSEK
jgi:hypothetical protein